MVEMVNWWCYRMFDQANDAANVRDRRLPVWGTSAPERVSESTGASRADKLHTAQDVCLLGELVQWRYSAKESQDGITRILMTRLFCERALRCRAAHLSYPTV